MELDRLTDGLLHRLFVELEASGRHVHVTKDQAMVLFGHDLTEKRPLSQPGQYLSNERVTLVGPKGRLERVAVLGPVRPEGQVEVSRTDAVMLGIEAPVRLSGDVANTPGITLEGPNGTLTLPVGVIVAQRHIHMTPEDAQLQNVKNGDTVRLKALTARPVIFEDVAVRISPKFRTFVHLDFDEANACGFKSGDLGMILK
ncbi:MAG: phosphate propanoyltransferase [Candidatus Avoscillospira sp.]